MSNRRNVLELFEEQKEFVDKKVSEGIEKYRKGDFKLTLTDANGKPIPNARVKFNQKSHEFKFGANLFMLDELETPEKNEAYKKYFAELFNMATLPFYWDATEPEKGKQRYDKDSPKIYRRPPIDLCIEFCEKHGIEPREHALAYDAFFPKWLYNASVDECKKELERRFSEIAERYADKIPTIEVTNEMEWVKGKTKFYDEPDFVEWCFKTAEKYFPKNKLCINEHNGCIFNDRCRASDKYYAYTEANMLKGARIDAIGMQYHLFFKAEEFYDKSRYHLDPERLYGIMDLYSNFGKPIQITEITVPAYSWSDEDEELQAEIIEKLYSVWFSHPSVEQIIYWNMVDGYAAFAPQGDMNSGENYYHGGLIRFDMTPKPAYYKIKELTQKRWHTEGDTETDNDGNAEIRGFFGKYELEITVDGNTVKREILLSSKNKNTVNITL